MIYFNISQPDADNHRLHLTQHNLVTALTKQQRQAQRIAELEAERDELIAENVRLTGQVHALLATIEQAVTA